VSAAPALLAGRRGRLAALLAAVALGEALLAVLFAGTLDRMLASPSDPLMPALAAGGLALLASLALLAQRWIGEDFAQSFVIDCREALFRAVTRHAGEGRDSPWLTGLINDMAALRNYALRGTVRLWTSMISAGGAGLWVLLTMPAQRVALLPLLLGALALALLASPLAQAIGEQRSQRGRLNRFLVRRVRAEMAGKRPAKGRGFRTLGNLSGDLGTLSVHRARWAGALDAVATLAGLAAALTLGIKAVGNGAGTALAGDLMLVAFIGARLLETARALHARIGGGIALDRLERKLSRPVRGRASHSRPVGKRAAIEPTTIKESIP
jgi:ABC-type multidrug transport system fused ATPase/permease subunit